MEIPTETRIGFLERMHSVLPGRLKGNGKIMATVTGGDACETAVTGSASIDYMAANKIPERAAKLGFKAKAEFEKTSQTTSATSAASDS